MSKRRIVFSAAFAIMVWTDGSHAATRRVPSEYPTIQAGIDAAAVGDIVLVAPGTYADYEIRIDGFPVASCAFLRDGVNLRSEGGPTVTTIDLQSLAGGVPYGIYAWGLSSGPTSVEGFTVNGDLSPKFGAVVFACSNFTFSECVFRDYQTSGGFGAAVQVAGDISIIDCEFTNCHADDAAAIWHADGHLDLIGCLIRDSGNRAVHIQGFEKGPLVSAHITGCQFLNNVGERSGAALLTSYAYGGVILRDCLFKGNVSHGGGGGAADLSVGPVTVEKCVFIENGTVAPAGVGGGLFVAGVWFPSMVRGNTFFKNHKVSDSSNGASVYFGSPGAFRNNVVVGSQGGGAISALGGPESIEASCNVYWENPEGVGIPLSPTDREVDPLFCDPVICDLTLRSGSPCLADDPLGCGLIGALGQGCGTISVEEKSWGAIKGLYR